MYMFLMHYIYLDSRTNLGYECIGQPISLMLDDFFIKVFYLFVTATAQQVNVNYPEML